MYNCFARPAIQTEAGCPCAPSFEYDGMMHSGCITTTENNVTRTWCGIDSAESCEMQPVDPEWDFCNGESCRRFFVV